MRIDLPYGTESRSLIVPAGVGVDYVTPRDATAFEDTADALERACSNPVDAPPLEELIRGKKTITILVSDLTRGGGTKEILPLLIDCLGQKGVPRDRIGILVARGTHRKLSKEEKKFFRTGPLQGVAVEEHDCDDNTRLSALLLTERGTPVRVNRIIKQSDLVIILSAISFHYFAGYGGGRKLIMPGCADRASIIANHRLSLQDTKPVELHANCRPGNLDANPVHEDMCEVLDAAGDTFTLNFFCDDLGRLIFLNAGGTIESHRQACDAYSTFFRVQAGYRASVLILSCGGHPYDLNLLQAHKALYHGTEIVNPGGAILFYAMCGEGVGSVSLHNAIKHKRDKFFAGAFENYDLNNQTGISLLTRTAKYRVAMVTEMDDDALASAGIERCTNAEAFVADTLDRYGANRITVVPSGSRTLPYVKE